jgi:hypothetical protein
MAIPAPGPATDSCIRISYRARILCLSGSKQTSQTGIRGELVHGRRLAVPCRGQRTQDDRLRHTLSLAYRSRDAKTPSAKSSPKAKAKMVPSAPRRNNLFARLSRPAMLLIDTRQSFRSTSLLSFNVALRNLQYQLICPCLSQPTDLAKLGGCYPAKYLL